MRCPFLREEQVKSCQAAPFRKSLARSAATGEGELCTSADHASCPVAPGSREAHPDAARCPFLRESLVQFCSAAARPTYVPWSESPELRCASDGHRFCELFLAAGLWQAPILQGTLPAERFTVVCNYHIIGVLKAVSLRWSPTASFNPVDQSVTVGTLSDCAIPQ